MVRKNVIKSDNHILSDLTSFFLDVSNTLISYDSEILEINQYHSLVLEPKNQIIKLDCVVGVVTLGHIHSNIDKHATLYRVLHIFPDTTFLIVQLVIMNLATPNCCQLYPDYLAITKKKFSQIGQELRGTVSHGSN